VFAESGSGAVPFPRAYNLASMTRPNGCAPGAEPFYRIFPRNDAKTCDACRYLIERAMERVEPDDVSLRLARKARDACLSF